jgi:hypothetical protein
VIAAWLGAQREESGRSSSDDESLMVLDRAEEYRSMALYEGGGYANLAGVSVKLRPLCKDNIDFF